MPTAFNIIDAVSASFFALLGVWAAVGRRHWFLRFAAIAGVLSTALLFHAYELVILFGLQMTLVAGGVWLARGRHNWRPRWSLETALLLMVVVAAGAAIAAKAPDFTLAHWLQMAGSGIAAAYAGLLSLWLIFGKARRWVRVVGLFVAVAVFLVLFHLGSALQYAASPGRSYRKWQDAFAAYYQWQYIGTWLAWSLPTVALTLAILFPALLLGRASRWFSIEPPDSREPLRRGAIAARATLTALLLILAVPLFYISYRLATPPEAPEVKLPVPNGYDDFIAAGKLAPANISQYIRPVLQRSLTPEKHQELFDQLHQLSKRVEIGLSKECQVPDPYQVQNLAVYERDLIAIHDADTALWLRRLFLQEYGSAGDFVKACLLEMRFAEECVRGAGIEASESQSISRCFNGLTRVLGNLDAGACRSLARELAEFDASREPFAKKAAVQWIIDQRRDWQTHLRLMLTEWSGDDPYHRDPRSDYWRLREIAELRLLTVLVALQAFVLEHGQPPDSIEELVPSYLTAIPLDPLGTGPLRYIRDRTTYKAYSYGADRDDDGGAEEDVGNGVGGDTVVIGPSPPTLGKILLDAAGAVYRDYVAPLLRKSED